MKTKRYNKGYSSIQLNGIHLPTSTAEKFCSCHGSQAYEEHHRCVQQYVLRYCKKPYV